MTNLLNKFLEKQKERTRRRSEARDNNSFAWNAKRIVDSEGNVFLEIKDRSSYPGMTYTEVRKILEQAYNWNSKIPNGIEFEWKEGSYNVVTPFCYLVDQKEKDKVILGIKGNLDRYGGVGANTRFAKFGSRDEPLAFYSDFMRFPETLTVYDQLNSVAAIENMKLRVAVGFFYDILNRTKKGEK